MKVCSKCGSDKTYVARTKRGIPYPHWHHDRECNLICGKCYMKQYYKDNRDDLIARMRVRYALSGKVCYGLNRDDILANVKVYNALHRDDYLAYQKARYTLCKDDRLAYNKEYRKRNRLRILECQRRYRLRQKCI